MNITRIRLTIILAGILVAGLALLAWTQPWFELVLQGGQPLTVPGQSAVPALSALGLASLALLGALSIAGRAIRVILGVLESAIGVFTVIVAAGALGNPAAASASTITEATAVSGPMSIAALIATVGTTAWPWVAIIAGILTVVVGVGVLVTGSRWPGPTRRYESAPAEDAGTPAGAWDTLTEGSDPTR
ncbi:MAG: Trp biosynthesis-associated membrane protein [Salinibacterium sp.]|nr:Trp biosynthesis-associated membrane protein [Salinibacterium sp.]